MGPKKQGGKGGKGGKGKKPEEEDNSTKEFLLMYKKSCRELEIPIHKPLESKVNKVIEEGVHLNEILIIDQFEPTSLKLITKALKATNKGLGYKHLQSLRFWDANINDEGMSIIHEYMSETSNTSIALIECLNCMITPIGCSIITKLFDPTKLFNIKFLTLDYNHFGNEGLANLMFNMKEARYLKYLSLANCMIDENGVKYFTDYFNSSECLLEILNLQGNCLKNSGVSELLTILYYNSSIEEINLNNTLCGSDPDLALLIARLMQANTTLGCYYFNFNMFCNDDMEIIMREALTTDTCKHIWRFKVDERMSKDICKEYYKLMKKRRKPKKKKGKKGKGKKGKKKAKAK